MKKISLLFILTLILSTAILADISLPDKKTPEPTPNRSVDSLLSVRISKDVKEARLVIPKNQIKELRADLEQLDSDSDNLAVATTGFSKTQTIISGTFLSFAILLGGVWMVRSRKINTKTGKILAIGTVLFISGAVVSMSFANVGPPSNARKITSKFFSNDVNLYKMGSGKIKLEVSDQVTYPTLYVPDVVEEK